MKFKILVILITFLTFFSCLKDKTLTTINGHIYDTTGIVNNNVTIISYDIDGVEYSRTNSTTGSYELVAKKNGTLKFISGYHLTSQRLIGDGEYQTIDINFRDDLFTKNYFGESNNLINNQTEIFENGTIKPIISNWGTFGDINDVWFTNTNYKGAINPDTTPWYEGWSFYSNIVRGDNISSPINISNVLDTINDSKINSLSDTIYWNKDITYVLDGLVYVNPGKVLVIEEGTIIQGMSGSGSEASGLVITRGSKIFAEGSPTNPIIFTFEGDNGNTEATQRGRWGGLILLGNASLNSTPGETQIEGIPTNELRGLYGGDNDFDNSGVLRYVSIRHGGSNIGADNEINGLTLGGVGSGTTIEYIEVIGNKDDGIEWFGGTVNSKWIISAYCADDALDYDEGYRGKNQFIIVHQNYDDADRGGEHDGGTNPEISTPFATPWFVNVTSIGNIGSRAITFRDNAGGYYYNSIFTRYSKGVDIEYLVGEEQDSYKQFEDGNLELVGNIFHNIGSERIFETSN